MPSTSTLLQFGLASLVLALTPGPSIVLLLAVGSERGRTASALTAVGLALGTSTWVAVTAAGLGALFAARPDLLDAVAALGGGYLLWLAIRAVRSADSSAREPAADATTGVARSPLVDGMVVNLLNPGLALFLAALLPPFIAPGRGAAWSQVVVLGSVLTAVSTVVNVGVGIAGAAAGGRLRGWVGGRRVALGAATVYATLGLLALATTLR